MNEQARITLVARVIRRASRRMAWSLSPEMQDKIIEAESMVIKAEQELRKAKMESEEIFFNTVKQ